ncbi:MAG TPA: type II toxin-antitoxin system HicA family toxin [Actinomycetota bacterium]|nr:type II toxin-antitoxin system HicA family toxin [Actinomycetota bacterium]
MIKRRDLETHLRANGCERVREGGRHSVWENPANGRRATVPRHREIPRGTTHSICTQLEIPDP